MNDNNEPTFHQRMVNIPVDEASAAFPEPPHLQLVYRYGHRDARHAAAEIANEADEAICELQRHIDDLTNGGALAAANAEIESLRADCKRLRSDLTRHEQCAEEVIRRTQRERRAALDATNDVRRDLIKIFETLRIEPSVAPAECLSTGAMLTCLLGWAQHRAGERHTANGRERFAAAVNEARAWMQAHRGGEWVGWSCAVLTGTQEVTSPGWYALPPGQWCSEPAILIDHATRDGLELPTVEQAVERWGVPVKAEE